MRRTLIAMLMLGAATPAMAQDGDVVMRRPLPFSRGITSTPDDCRLTNTCPDDDNGGDDGGDDGSTESGTQTAYIAAEMGCSSGATQSSLACLSVTIPIPYDGSEPMANGIADNSMCASQSPSAPAYQALAAMLPQEMLISPAAVADYKSYNCSTGPISDPDFGDDPTKIVDNPDEGGYPSFYTWVPGPWEGEGQCGSTASLTRTMTCVGVYHRGGEIIGRVDSQGPMLASSSAQGPLQQSIAEAVSENPGTMRLAQFGGDSNEYDYRPTSPDHCLMELGPPPPTTYTGQKAGCGYTVEEGAWGEWTHPYGGNATCSSDAVRSRFIQCVDRNRSPVEMEYCFNDLKPGGQANYQLQDTYTERGNYSGCTAEWKEDASYQGCQGPIETQVVSYHCERSDGEWLYGVDEAACGPKPGLDGQVKQIGTCFQARPSWVGYCSGTYMGKVMDLPNYLGSTTSNNGETGSYYYEGSDACLSKSCCAVMFNYDTSQYELGEYSGSFNHGYRYGYENGTSYFFDGATRPIEWWPSGYRTGN